MRSRLLLCTVLAVLLALSSPQNAFSSTEIAYDNGTEYGGGGMGSYVGVRFTIPGGASGTLRQVKFVLSAYPTTVVVYITGSDHTTVITSFSVTVTGPSFWTASVPGGGVSVPSEFFIILGPRSSGSMVFDNVANVGRSYLGSSLAGLSPAPSNYNNMLIRAIVDPIPTNTITASTSRTTAAPSTTTTAPTSSAQSSILDIPISVDPMLIIGIAAVVAAAIVTAIFLMKRKPSIAVAEATTLTPSQTTSSTPAATKYCINCGTSIPETARHCPRCGAPQQ